MSNYDADSIKLYEGVEHVRMRPGMYIGGTDKRALHRLIELIVDNAVDMALAGYGSHIEIVLQENQTIKIVDYSGGLRLDFIPDGSKTFAEKEMTSVSAGSALDPERPSFWNVGLHSVGVGVANGLSEWFKLDIRRDAFEWRQSYKCGKPTAPFSIRRALDTDEIYGNTFTFRPDFTIMDQNEFDFDFIADQLQIYAYATQGMLYTLRDERGFPFQEQEFCARDGILDYLHIKRGEAKPLHDPIFLTDEYLLSTYSDNLVQIELALQFTDRRYPCIESFINAKHNLGDGTHITGLMNALNAYIDGQHLPKHVTNGMIAIINIRHPDLRFETNSMLRLINTDLLEPMQALTSKALHQIDLS